MKRAGDLLETCGAPQAYWAKMAEQSRWPSLGLLLWIFIAWPLSCEIKAFPRSQKKFIKCSLSRRQRRTVCIWHNWRRQRREWSASNARQVFLESSNILLEEPPSILGRLSPLRYSSVKYQVSQIEKQCLRKDSCKNLECFLRAEELGRQFSQDACRLRSWCTKDLCAASVFPLSGPGNRLCRCRYSVSLSPYGEVYASVGLVPSTARTQLREFWQSSQFWRSQRAKVLCSSVEDSG